ncbi:hypothetical protein GCM10011607_11960 [Shewanella inventionis]|uniref:Uncharacterized protein n=1 Tax=Shewanella inventionis TaxID=1738770 RepID=A0ABQ1IWT2_9GAMM|nr:hypothetical protein [Shewanella inventionis]GGB53058.1 hypothetical protein GCM10011607_11960 [Shewanella inventionis]
MNTRIMKELTRNPEAFASFITKGELPQCKKSPETPLRNLIESIPMGIWTQFQGIRLSPALGFNSSLQFHSLHQLYRWLGGNQKLIGNQTLPYMSWRNVRFQTQLSIQDLIFHSAKSPSNDVLERYNLTTAKV